MSPSAETAFTVLAAARALKALGKDVVELEIGDSPFPSTPHAKRAGILAIEENQTGYCPSLGLPQFRAASSGFWDYLRLFRFTGDLFAMPEGTVAFPNEPIAVIRAPIVDEKNVDFFYSRHDL